jgi:predicted nucleic acid-binding Zn ribbon protein
MSAEPLKNCPKCNGRIKRLIGPGSSPIFKGKGFYQTDYKNKPVESSAKKEPAKPAVKEKTPE